MSIKIIYEVCCQDILKAVQHTDSRMKIYALFAHAKARGLESRLNVNCNIRVNYQKIIK